ncbi:MAG: hypothetical protein HWN80_08525 [Candidatus Lokiarchaeota archaeon]|nr:hypothetical protein [Candidatus Lokiarchaeota archaeon]
MSHQMAALETAQRKLRKFCRTLPKCSDTLNCDTCEIINKIEDINDWLAILGDLQQEWDPDLEKIDPKFETDLLTSYFKLFF